MTELVSTGWTDPSCSTRCRVEGLMLDFRAAASDWRWRRKSWQPVPMLKGAREASMPAVLLHWHAQRQSWLQNFPARTMEASITYLHNRVETSCSLRLPS